MKKAIIIGASSGIGRELARQLAHHDYHVIAMARRIDLLNSLHTELPNSISVKQIDVSQTDVANNILSGVIEAESPIDLLVFAAGIGELNDELDLKIEQNTITTNVLGFIAICNIAIKHFIKQEHGHLAAISSIAAIRGSKASPAYNASKAFISNYLQGIRQKVMGQGYPITITDIKPGFVDTAMAKGSGLFWVTSEKKAARQIVQAIVKKKSHCYVSKRWRLIAWLLKIMPNSLYNRL